MYVCVCVCCATALRFDGSHMHTHKHVCLCVCVCQGHWQKAEVLLGNDFSFLFAPAALPFRGRLLCSAPLLYKLYIFAPAPAEPLPCPFSCSALLYPLGCSLPPILHVFLVFLIVVGAFVDIFIHSLGVCVCDCLCVYVCVCLHIRLAHISYIMVTK